MTTEEEKREEMLFQLHFTFLANCESNKRFDHLWQNIESIVGEALLKERADMIVEDCDENTIYELLTSGPLLDYNAPRWENKNPLSVAYIFYYQDYFDEKSNTFQEEGHRNFVEDYLIPEIVNY